MEKELYKVAVTLPKDYYQDFDAIVNESIDEIMTRQLSTKLINEIPIEKLKLLFNFKTLTDSDKNVLLEISINL